MSPASALTPCTIIAEDDTADREPSLGWTADGQFGNCADLEQGAPAVAPQNVRELNEATVWVDHSHRRFSTG